METERKALASAKTPAAVPAEASSNVAKALSRRMKELEDVVTAQKSFLLDVGSKVHELELQLRRISGVNSDRDYGQGR